MKTFCECNHPALFVIQRSWTSLYRSGNRQRKWKCGRRAVHCDVKVGLFYIPVHICNTVKHAIAVLTGAWRTHRHRIAMWDLMNEHRTNSHEEGAIGVLVMK